MRLVQHSILLFVLSTLACGKETIVEPYPVPPATIPGPPMGVTASGGAGFVRVTWSDRSDNEDGFVVGRAELATVDQTPTVDALSDLVTVTADQIVFRDDSVTPGRFYAYGVAAKSSAGRSGFVIQSGPAVASTVTSSAGPCAISVPSPEDEDGDGLPTELETEGWTVRIDENGMGSFSERVVNSGPQSADFDEDGLCDALERILRTDPNRADTDGDGLSDADEVRVYGSSPINVDSDADSTGNTAFYDGAELSRYGTSPTLADTDGDGRSDFVEINQNSTNALLADLPRPEISVDGAIDLGVNVRISETVVEEDAVTTGLTQSTENATGKTNSTATTVSSETSVEVGASAEISFPAGASVSVSASYGQTDGYMKEASSAISQESSNTAQTAYEAATSRELSQRQTVEGGSLAVTFQIHNAGNRTFQLSNLVISALTRDRRNPKSFSPVASLVVAGTEDQGITLSDGQSVSNLEARADIPASVALDLMANPSALYFRPATFNLKDRTGQNFEFSVGETTSNRTALLVIDYGGGRDLETYRVATNVARRDGGKLAGVKMSKVLEEVIGLPANDDTGYRTAVKPGGARILTRIRDQAVTQRGAGSSKFWMVMAAENTTGGVSAAERLLDPSVDFEDLVLMPRDRVYLAYQADEDADGLFKREEQQYRTSDTDTDTDDDGLSDLEEIREGWLVLSGLPFYSSNPRVFSSPTRDDADRDGLLDPEEKTLGTDPNRADTDGDGLDDGVDPEPSSGLAAPLRFVIGTVANELPSDIVADSNGNLYVMGRGRGDLDGDGWIATDNNFGHSKFLGSWDANGNRRWMIELESLPGANLQGQNSKLVIDDNDHLWWMGSFEPADLPGVTVTGLQLIEMDTDGVVLSASPFSYPSNPGLISNFGAYWLKKIGTQFIAVGSNLNNYDAKFMIFDSTGAVSSALLAPSSPFEFTAAGSLAGFSLISGCSLQNYSLAGAPEPGTSYCATLLQIHRAERADDGSVFLAYGTGAVSKFGANGALVWTNNAPPGAESIFGLHVDRLGRSYVLTTKPFPSRELVVRSVTAVGSDGFLFTVPENFVSFLPYVDKLGNFYVVGNSDNALGGGSGIMASGGEDVVVLRNPQYLFE